MIYLDNAATSYPKPESVYRRTDEVLRYIGGNPGRGSHRMAIEAGRVVFQTRETIAKLISIENSARIIFTKNATEAINIAIKCILKEGDHVVATGVEHNSVSNAIRRLEGLGVKATWLGVTKEGTVRPGELDGAISSKTRLVCVTHASNVFGTIQPIYEIGQICRRRGVPLMVDAAQTLGHMPIDLSVLNIDMLAATGHKALFGPQGTGFLYVKEGMELPPFIDGGTGEDGNFIDMPERMESGTMNTPGIGGLGAGVEYLLREDIRKIREYEEGLTRRLISGLKGINGLNIIGTDDASKRVSLVSFNINGMEAAEVGYRLDSEFSIMVRSGLHCAPDAHRRANTYPQGAVRVSPGYFNTILDIDELVNAVSALASGR